MISEKIENNNYNKIYNLLAIILANAKKFENINIIDHGFKFFDDLDQVISMQFIACSEIIFLLKKNNLSRVSQIFEKNYIINKTVIEKLISSVNIIFNARKNFTNLNFKNQEKILIINKEEKKIKSIEKEINKKYNPLIYDEIEENYKIIKGGNDEIIKDIKNVSVLQGITGKLFDSMRDDNLKNISVLNNYLNRIDFEFIGNTENNVYLKLKEIVQENNINIIENINIKEKNNNNDLDIYKLVIDNLIIDLKEYIKSKNIMIFKRTIEMMKKYNKKNTINKEIETDFKFNDIDKFDNKINNLKNIIKELKLDLSERDLSINNLEKEIKNLNKALNQKSNLLIQYEKLLKENLDIDINKDKSNNNFLNEEIKSLKNNIDYLRDKINKEKDLNKSIIIENDKLKFEINKIKMNSVINQDIDNKEMEKIAYKSQAPNRKNSLKYNNNIKENFNFEKKISMNSIVKMKSKIKKNSINSTKKEPNYNINSKKNSIFYNQNKKMNFIKNIENKKMNFIKNIENKKKRNSIYINNNINIDIKSQKAINIEPKRKKVVTFHNLNKFEDIWEQDISEKKSINIKNFEDNDDSKNDIIENIENNPIINIMEPNSEFKVNNKVINDKIKFFNNTINKEKNEIKKENYLKTIKESKISNWDNEDINKPNNYKLYNSINTGNNTSKIVKNEINKSNMPILKKNILKKHKFSKSNDLKEENILDFFKNNAINKTININSINNKNNTNTSNKNRLINKVNINSKKTSMNIFRNSINNNSIIKSKNIPNIKNKINIIDNIFEEWFKKEEIKKIKVPENKKAFYSVFIKNIIDSKLIDYLILATDNGKVKIDKPIYNHLENFFFYNLVDPYVNCITNFKKDDKFKNKNILNIPKFTIDKIIIN